MAVLADGRRALSGSADSTLKLWDLDEGREIRTLIGHANWVLTVAVLADGRRALSGSRDGTVKLWDLDTGAILATFTADAGVTCIAVAQDNLFVAGDEGGGVHILKLVE